MATLLNEELDEAAVREFSAVHEWVTRVERGEVLLRSFTEAELTGIWGVLDDVQQPHEPEESLECVREYAEQVLTALRDLASPHEESR
jgi:hypothetical protein